MADLITRLAGQRARVLDYGCGEGQLIAAALERGHEVHGCDRYDGLWAGFGDGAVHKERIRQIESNGQIPFPDGAFDIVVANQVFEHIPEFERPLAEIHRVLKPGGLFLNCFPTAEVWWEGHQKAPFAQHFFSSPERWRRYLLVMHWLRIGKGRKGKTAKEWAHASRKIPDICAYKSLREVEGRFARWFDILPGAEPDWVRHRLQNHRYLRFANPPRVFDPLLRLLCSKLASRVFVLRRKGSMTARLSA